MIGLNAKELKSTFYSMVETVLQDQMGPTTALCSNVHFGMVSMEGDEGLQYGRKER